MSTDLKQESIVPFSTHLATVSAEQSENLANTTEQRVCPICTLEYDITAYVPCGHSICYKCFLKIRKLCEKEISDKCPVCKEIALRPLLYSTSWFSKQTRYDSLESFFKATNDAYDKYYETDRKKFQLTCDSRWSNSFNSFIHRSASSTIAELESLKCPFYRVQKNNEIKGETRDILNIKTSEELVALNVTGHIKLITCTHETGEFSDFKSLRKHLEQEHGVSYCSVCIDFKPSFLIDQPLFDIKSLKTHIHESHKLCVLCGKNQYDMDSLKQHLHTKHLRCELCRKFSNNDSFWKDNEDYRKHIAETHYTCPVPECKSILTAYATKVECAKHIIADHSSSLSSEDKKKWKSIIGDQVKTIIDPEEIITIKTCSLASRFGPRYAVYDKPVDLSGNDIQNDHNRDIKSSLSRGTIHIAGNNQTKTDEEIIRELINENRENLNDNDNNNIALVKPPKKSNKRFIELNLSDPNSMENAQIAMAIKHSLEQNLNKTPSQKRLTKKHNNNNNDNNKQRKDDGYSRVNTDLFSLKNDDDDEIKKFTKNLANTERKYDTNGFPIPIRQNLAAVKAEEEEIRRKIDEANKEKLINEAAKMGIELQIIKKKKTKTNKTNNNERENEPPKRKYEDPENHVNASYGALNNLQQNKKQQKKIVNENKPKKITYVSSVTKKTDYKPQPVSSKSTVTSMEVTAVKSKQKQQNFIMLETEDGNSFPVYVNSSKVSYKSKTKNRKESKTLTEEEKELSKVEKSIDDLKKKFEKRDPTLVKDGDATEYALRINELEKQKNTWEKKIAEQKKIKEELAKKEKELKKQESEVKKSSLIDTEARIKMREIETKLKENENRMEQTKLKLNIISTKQKKQNKKANVEREIFIE